MPTDSDMRAAFLASIIETPGDDVPRLIYADWLEDHGEELRAEFIRVQVELQKPFRNGPGAVERCREMVAREHEIMSMARGDTPIWADWAGPAARCLSSVLGFAGRDECLLLRRGLVAEGDECLLFRRGFVAEVHCPLAAWLEHGPEVVRAHPVEVIHLTDREPDRFARGVEPVERFRWWGWVSLRGPMRGDCVGAIFEHLDTNYFLDGYDSPDQAHDALSRACLAWARS